MTIEEWDTGKASDLQATDAGRWSLWIRGNLSPTDSVTPPLISGLGRVQVLTEIAAMLGDTVAVVERHYADLASKRMESRLSKMPTRRWEKYV